MSKHLHYRMPLQRHPILPPDEQLELSRLIEPYREAIEAGKSHAEISKIAESDPAMRGALLAREKLICSNIRLIKSYVHHYRYNNVPADDVFQEGFKGLEYAVLKFDHTRGINFSSYASLLIQRAMQNLDARYSRMPYPAWVGERMSQINRLQKAFLAEHGRHPTRRQILKAIEMPAKTLDSVLTAAQTIQVLSLDKKNDNLLSLINLVADEREEEPISLVAVDQLVNDLPDKEKEVLHLRFYEGWTLDRLGAKYGVTRETARKRVNAAVNRLQRHPQVEQLRDLLSA